MMCYHSDMRKISTRSFSKRRPTSISEQLKPYEGYLARTHAKTTAIKYNAAAKRFAVSFGDRAPGDLKATDIDVYLATWNDDYESRYRRPPSRDTYRNQITALKAF